MPLDWTSLLYLTAAGLAGAAVAVRERSAPERDEAPIRGELYSREQLVEHARALAEQHDVAPGRQRGRQREHDEHGQRDPGSHR